jgi:stage II sporulation protein D
METFGKAPAGLRGAWATVLPVGRLALVVGAAALLAAGGATAALLVPGPGAAAVTTSTTVTTATTIGTTTVVQTSPTVLAFTGHGWGHGLGLSQWGAYGYALHGWTHDRILAHYYPGTTLGTARTRIVRVLVAAAKRVTVRATAAWSATDSTGAKTTLEPGSVTIGTGLAVQGERRSGPVTLTSAEPLAVNGTAYRGTLVLSVDGQKVDAVDVVALEQYLKGVVPSEMPSAWPSEALQAQAVAARSYALANLAKGRPYDLYGDARSQVYGGVAAESAAASAAVDATKGTVVLFNGKVADTLFFSTSGGRTASSLESTGIDVPYLEPVADPYDTLSPYHDWGPVLFDAAAVARTLKLSAPIAAVDVTGGDSGRVKSVVVTSDDESEVRLTGNQVRAELGLRSTWFQPALFRLLPAAKRMTFGGAVSLAGLAVGADGVTLEAKPVGADWAGAGDVVPGADGSFAPIVKPQVSTSYRLAWGTARLGLARVTVTARVTAVASPTGIQGTLRPVVPGAPVQLQQRQDDGTWTTLSSTAADQAAGWSFGGAPAPGTYRVRAAPGHGVAAGVSAAITVR